MKRRTSSVAILFVLALGCGGSGQAGADGEDGAAGPPGMDGEDGRDSVIRLTPEPPGVHCPDGGQRIEVGLDRDGDGVLGDDEVNEEETGFVCAVAEVTASPEVVQVSAGQHFACAVLAGGGVKCWGENMFGQAGAGVAGGEVQLPVDIMGLEAAAEQVSAGFAHACALLTTGGVQCWGYNVYGQLGDGTTIDAPRPVNVTGLEGDVTALSTGIGHSCALLEGGEVMCWGRNDHGQLGDGQTIESPVPVEASGLGSAIKVSAGGSGTCAILSDGALYCWGRNQDGQVGDGTLEDAPTPVEVKGLPARAAAVSVGAEHTCVALASGEVMCWGRNDHGQLGDGTLDDSPTPVKVEGVSGAIDVAVVRSNTCALTSSGGIKCWGRNRYGELGNGATTPHLAPVDVVGLADGGEMISGGSDHYCAMIRSGRVLCWGARFGGATPTPVRWYP